MVILHDAGIAQGGFGAAEGASQQLTVLREAAGFDMMFLQDAGRDRNLPKQLQHGIVLEHIGVWDAWVKPVTRTLLWTIREKSQKTPRLKPKRPTGKYSFTRLPKLKCVPPRAYGSVPT